MAAIAVGERKNGGALIVVRIVLSSGFDPADYSVFQALFPRSDKAFTPRREKAPVEVQSHRGPLPNTQPWGVSWVATNHRTRITIVWWGRISSSGRPSRHRRRF